MESRWRFNIPRLGLALSSISLCAECIPPWNGRQWLGAVGTGGNSGVAFNLALGPNDELMFVDAIPFSAADNFPYGIPVEPDH